MIRKRAQLMEAIERGATLARSPLDARPGAYGWLLEPSGEAVDLRAVNWAVAEEKVQWMTRDIAGEPMRYGLANSMTVYLARRDAAEVVHDAA
jgi:hypothetical protein